jgi:hypothetical protein
MDLRKTPSNPNPPKDLEMGTKTGTSEEALFCLDPLIFNPGMGAKAGTSENDSGSPLLRCPANLIPTQSIVRVNANADNVPLIHKREIYRIQGFIEYFWFALPRRRGRS